MKSFLYTLLKISNDMNAINKGKIPRRIGRRIYGKGTGSLARRIFK